MAKLKEKELKDDQAKIKKLIEKHMEERAAVAALAGCEVKDDPEKEAPTPYAAPSSSTIFSASASPKGPFSAVSSTILTPIEEEPIEDNPVCPKCGKDAEGTMTEWGWRHQCCDLYSWNKGRLVTAAVHKKRSELYKKIKLLSDNTDIKKAKIYESLGGFCGLREPFKIQDLDEDQIDQMIVYMNVLNKIKKADEIPLPF